MAAISAFRVTQHSQIFFHFSSEIEFNALRFINYIIPRLCSTYTVATLVIYGLPMDDIAKMRPNSCGKSHMILHET